MNSSTGGPYKERSSEVEEFFNEQTHFHDAMSYKLRENQQCKERGSTQNIIVFDSFSISV